MKTKHYVLQIFRATFTDRLVLIIIVLMIASVFAVLPIKSCSNPGASGGTGISATSSMRAKACHAKVRSGFAITRCEISKT
ncbi:hypothetical protein [Ensifer sp. CCNWLW38]